MHRVPAACVRIFANTPIVMNMRQCLYYSRNLSTLEYKVRWFSGKKTLRSLLQMAMQMSGITTTHPFVFIFALKIRTIWILFSASCPS